MEYFESISILQLFFIKIRTDIIFMTLSFSSGLPYFLKSKLLVSLNFMLFFNGNFKDTIYNDTYLGTILIFSERIFNEIIFELQKHNLCFS